MYTLKMNMLIVGDGRNPLPKYWGNSNSRIEIIDDFPCIFTDKTIGLKFATEAVRDIVSDSTLEIAWKQFDSHEDSYKFTYKQNETWGVEFFASFHSFVDEEYWEQSTTFDYRRAFKSSMKRLGVE